MALTTYAANELLDGGTLPATFYAQLHTGDPGDDLDENVSVLVPDRVEVSFGSAVGGVISNDAAVTFDEAALDDPETIVFVSLHDASTGGNAWIFDALLAPQDIATGDPLRFPIGQLRMRFS